MAELSFAHFLWAVTLGAVSAVSLPLGSLVGLRRRFPQRFLAAFAAFGAGALIAALSVELVAPTSQALVEASEAGAVGEARTNFIALIIGSVCGGLLFVALDEVVNHQGGYIRKRSTTLAHMAALRRDEVRQQLQGVLNQRPFNALPPESVPLLAGMLRPQNFRKDETLPRSDENSATAYLTLEGVLDIEFHGRHAESAGPGTLIGLLTLLVPHAVSLFTAKATTDVKCLALTREDMDMLRSAAPAFDQACRELASERLDRLEQHLITRFQEAVEWTRSAAGALRRGVDVPNLLVPHAHAGHHGSPLAVWLGILLDGIPESLVIGAGLFVVLAHHPAVETLRFLQVIPYTLVAGLFLSNFPEALSSSANMLACGWTSRRIFLMWFALMVTTAVGAGLGFLLACVLSEAWLVFAEGVAAGAMLTMIAAAMIPEAAAHGRTSEVGLSTLAGFLAAILFKLLE